MKARRSLEVTKFRNEITRTGIPHENAFSLLVFEQVAVTCTARTVEDLR